MAQYLDKDGLTYYDKEIKKYIDAADDALIWSGTREEYEAEKDTLPAGTFVIITDEAVSIIERIDNNEILGLFN